MDGGNDAIENIDVVLSHNKTYPEHAGTDFLIKWNPRKQNAEQWLAIANEKATWSQPREGKRVGLFETRESRQWNGVDYSVRRVMRLTERTIDKHGQQLLIPELTLEGWWTSLVVDAQAVIDLYADHGTSEQFHSEFKTDLDIERLPSGKFATNTLVLACAAFAYNILRWIGQNGLTGPDAPIRHAAKRRRIKTVMQELMYVASRLINTGRRLKLTFAKHCHAIRIFHRLYDRLAYG